MFRRFWSHGAIASLVEEFIPTDIPGCVLDIESDLGVVKDGSNYMVSWADQTGLHNFSRNNITQHVVWVPNEQNGYPAINSLDNAQNPLYTDMYMLNDCTIFLVGKNGENLGENGPGFSIGYGGDSTGPHFLNFRMYMDTTRLDFSGYDFDLYSIAACTRQGIAISFYQNGGLVETGEQPIWDPNWAWQFGRLMYVGDYGQVGGFLLAAIQYDSVLSAPNLALVNSYLNTKFAIY